MRGQFENRPAHGSPVVIEIFWRPQQQTADLLAAWLGLSLACLRQHPLNPIEIGHQLGHEIVRGLAVAAGPSCCRWAGLKCRVAARQLSPRPSLRTDRLSHRRILQNHWHHSLAVLT